MRYMICMCRLRIGESRHPKHNVIVSPIGNLSSVEQTSFSVALMQVRVNDSIRYWYGTPTESFLELSFFTGVLHSLRQPIR